MNIPIVDFYKEVTGVKSASTPIAKATLQRWHVPIFTTTRDDSAKKFWKVDIAELAKAKAAYAIEHEARQARAEKKKPKLHSSVVDAGDAGLMQRMANVEQELRSLKTALLTFMEKYA